MNHKIINEITNDCQSGILLNEAPGFGKIHKNEAS